MKINKFKKLLPCSTIILHKKKTYRLGETILVVTILLARSTRSLILS